MEKYTVSDTTRFPVVRHARERVPHTPDFYYALDVRTAYRTGPSDDTPVQKDMSRTDKMFYYAAIAGGVLTAAGITGMIAWQCYDVFFK
ncbi:MAG: hypothetical protein ACOCWQ_03665 [Nanoarchaeota archaeon]